MRFFAGPTVIVMIAAWCCIVIGAEAARGSGDSYARTGGSQRGAKQPRTTRGFKARELSTAYSYGKRALYDDYPQQENAVEALLADRMADSFPLDWFVEEMQANPALTRSFLHKFVDINGDGLLTAEELLRPVTF